MISLSTEVVLKYFLAAQTRMTDKIYYYQFYHEYINQQIRFQFKSIWHTCSKLVIHIKY